MRNTTGKNLVFAFMGGYHGRTLAASAITSSYRYRRRFGHFSDRAHFVPFPYCFRCPYDKKVEDCGLYCLKQFEKNFETEYNSFWDAKAGEAEFAGFLRRAHSGHRRLCDSAARLLRRAAARFSTSATSCMVDDEIQMGFYRAGKFWAIENFGVAPDIIVFGKALTNGLNPLSGVWAREDLIAPGRVSAGVDALDILVEYARHGRRARGRPHDGGARLRANDAPEGRVVPGADPATCSDAIPKSSATPTGWAWPCASRSAAPTVSGRIAS